MQKLYHISNVSGLKILTPKESSHGKPYVYATKNLPFALFFGSTKSYKDFDGNYGVRREENVEKAFFYEAYEGAFERRFKGESCYVYEVDPTNFKEGLTGFSGEVVSEVPVKVLKETKIDDLYDELQKLIRANKIIFRKYDKKDEKQMQKIKEHIKSRILISDLLNRKETEVYAFCKEKFSDIISEIEEEN